MRKKNRGEEQVRSGPRKERSAESQITLSRSTNHESRSLSRSRWRHTNHDVGRESKSQRVTIRCCKLRDLAESRSIFSSQNALLSSIMLDPFGAKHPASPIGIDNSESFVGTGGLRQRGSSGFVIFTCYDFKRKTTVKAMANRPAN